ncbi:hypothetical protein CROQUDRAFT_650035 [Cronartium quercuum f. sp. fusiforme G11]|uniref:Wings apart-like protein C-terminal domain-containing protein n=1 Tax=Cronartium quercuum f. sp. fusiforme G11 TaxID=708437 RepID=A0A9P6P065_9BASI|nr:hypothetical protein CROQUDRAFT_650035 [Cronartium quercuum f. sp. fusiforme G11]
MLPNISNHAQRIRHTYGKRPARAIPIADFGRVEGRSPIKDPDVLSRAISSPPSSGISSRIYEPQRQKACDVVESQGLRNPITTKEAALTPSPRKILPLRASRQQRGPSSAVSETADHNDLTASTRVVKPTRRRTSPTKAKTTPLNSPASKALDPKKKLVVALPRLPASTKPRILKRSISLGNQDQSLSMKSLKRQTLLQPPIQLDPSPAALRRSPRHSTSGSKRTSTCLEPFTKPEKSRAMPRALSSVSLDLSMPSGSRESKSTRPMRTRRSAGMTIKDIVDEQPAGPKDLSNIFAVLENKSTRMNQVKITSPKRRRVSHIATRSNSASGILSPPHSPTHSSTQDLNHSTPPKKSAHLSASGLNFDVEASGSSTKLFKGAGHSTRTLSRHVSSEILGLPITIDTINCANLAAALGTGGGIKKTYGGQRTFKHDDNEVNILLPVQSDGPSSSAPKQSSVAGSTQVLNALKMKPRETYSDLRKKWGVDEDEDEDEDECQLDLRTISHQRAMGSSKRFVDEVSYLFEGLSEYQESGDLDFKRIGALELIRKLNDKEFIKNLKMNGMIEQFYDVLRSAGAGDGDIILDLSLLVFISILCCEHQKILEPILRIVPKNSTDPLSTESDCLQVLANIINKSVKKDNLVIRGGMEGLSKRESKLMVDIAQVIKKSPVGKRVKDCTSSIMLALFSVSSISAFLPRPGLLPHRAIIRSGAYRAILGCLATDTGALKGRLEAYTQGSDLLPPDAVSVVHRVNSCMDVIEACTICEEEGMMVLDDDRNSLASCFVTLLPLCHMLATQRDQGSASQGLDILIGCLRTMVNATNHHEDWAELLTTPNLLQTLCGTLNLCRQGYEEFMNKSAESDGLPKDDSGNASDGQHGGISQKAREVVFDLICVTLGLFANLIEQSLEGKHIIKTIFIHGPGLPTARECSVKCKCDNPISALEELIGLYVNPPSMSPAETEFVRGSICALLSFCLDMGIDEDVSILKEVLDSNLRRRKVLSKDQRLDLMESLMIDIRKWKGQSSKVNTDEDD